MRGPGCPLTVPRDRCWPPLPCGTGLCPRLRIPEVRGSPGSVLPRGMRARGWGLSARYLCVFLGFGILLVLLGQCLVDFVISLLRNHSSEIFLSLRFSSCFGFIDHEFGFRCLSLILALPICHIKSQNVFPSSSLLSVVS